MPKRLPRSTAVDYDGQTARFTDEDGDSLYLSWSSGIRSVGEVFLQTPPGGVLLDARHIVDLIDLLEENQRAARPRGAK